MLKNLTKYLLILTILTIPFYFIRFNITPVPTTILEILIYLTFVAAAISGLLKGLITKNPRAFYFGLIFVLAGLFSALNDPSRIAGLGLFKAYFFDGFLLFCVVLQSVKEGEISKKALVYSGIVSAVVALILFFTGTKTGDGRLFDLEKLSPNYLAMYLSPIFVISLALGFNKFAKNWPYLIGSSILLLALYLTGSRGSILAIIAGSLVLLLGYLAVRGYGKTAKPLFLVALLVLLIGGYAVYRPDFTDHARKATSSNIRSYIWSTSVEMIGKNPVLGVGLSNYQNYFSNMTKNRVNFPEFISPQALSAHNIYLQFYVVGGAFLFIAFMLLILMSGFWSTKDIALCAALVVILVYALVDTPFFRNDLAAEFWVIIALIYSLGKKVIKSTK